MTWLLSPHPDWVTFGGAMVAIGAALIAPNFVFCPTTAPIHRYALDNIGWVAGENRQLPRGRRWHIHDSYSWTTLHRHTTRYVVILWIEQALIAGGALMAVSYGFLVR
jgi:hypothetical protein